MLSAQGVQPLIKECLTERDYEIISTRYGFGESQGEQYYGDEKTYKEMVDLVHVSESKLRYEITKIQKKLKSFLNSKSYYKVEDLIDVE